LSIKKYLTIHEASELLNNREISAVELAMAHLQIIETLEPNLKAFTTITAELSLKQAEDADQRLKRGESTPLTGVPVAIKDAFCTAGVRTTCSSRMLENFVPSYDATAIKKLKGAGMVMLGKTNMDEFAMGSSTENSAFFTTHNPWDTSRVPGGSSGGSAVAVAAGEAIYALGSDTGGSIRQPASFCSIVGLKPTYGRVSRFGLVAYASSFDQAGPMTQDVTDAALVLGAIAGHDASDTTSADRPVPNYTKSLTGDIKGLRLGIPKEYFTEGLQPEVSQTMHAAITKLEELGAVVDWSASLPSTPLTPAVYYIIASSEASANLARYDGIKYGFSYSQAENVWEAIEKARQFGFGQEVKRRIMIGTHALSASCYNTYYLKAQKVRTLICREFKRAFEKYDALIAPTSPTVPFVIGEKAGNPLQMYLADACTIPVNIAGLPAISVPAGFVGGLPVGLQIIAQPFAEETIFKIAYAYEQAAEWHKLKPKILYA